MDWSYDFLWQKAKIFIQRAHEQDRDTPLFPLWATLSLELLARTTLAKVHPALLADPSEGENLLYVFELSTTKAPKSIPVKTVFQRCMSVAPKFTKNEFDFCMNLMERRNRELHTGAAAFEGFSTGLWLYDFYRIIQILLESQDKELKDILSPEDADMAGMMISKEMKKIENDVKAMVRLHKDDFYRQADVEQKKVRRSAEEKNKVFQAKYKSNILCPACKTEALRLGEKTRAGEPYLDGEVIIRQFSVLPTKFICNACGLKLEGYEKLHSVGLGGQFTIEESYEPTEYFDFDPMDYWEPDYGND